MIKSDNVPYLTFDYIKPQEFRNHLLDCFLLHVKVRIEHSSFLIWNAAGMTHTDREKCIETFQAFFKGPGESHFFIIISLLYIF